MSQMRPAPAANKYISREEQPARLTAHNSQRVRFAGSKDAIARTTPKLVCGLLYMKTADSWTLGDAVVTDTALIIFLAASAAHYQLLLKDVNQTKTLSFLAADFEQHAFDLQLKSGDAVRFRALDSFQLRDFADTIDDVVQGYYPQWMPPVNIVHDVPNRAELPVTAPLQVHLVAAAKARGLELSSGAEPTDDALLAPPRGPRSSPRTVAL
jgi:hypothetical protein